MEELEKCPFCGEELEIVGNGHYYAHKFNGCVLQHLCFECDDIEAIEAWNTRKPMERIVERLEDRIDITWKHDYMGGRKDAFVESIEIVKEEMS